MRVNTARMTPPARVGTAWLTTGLPVGALVGWLAGISDDASDRRLGAMLLALGVASAAVGVALLVSRSRRLRPVSLVLTAAWVVVAVLLVAVAEFRQDQLWAGGLTGLVVVATGLAALAWRRA